MKSLIVQGKINRRKLYRIEIKKKILHTLKHNDRLNLKWWSKYKLNTTIKTLINTRCIITGRSRGVNKTFKFSRLEIPRWIRLKLLPGLDKSSW
jgi:ribosomal protein S14